jgi:hypothetical protein
MVDSLLGQAATRVPAVVMAVSSSSSSMSARLGCPYCNCWGVGGRQSADPLQLPPVVAWHFCRLVALGSELRSCECSWWSHCAVCCQLQLTAVADLLTSADGSSKPAALDQQLRVAQLQGHPAMHLLPPHMQHLTPYHTPRCCCCCCCGCCPAF